MTQHQRPKSLQQRLSEVSETFAEPAEQAEPETADYTGYNPEILNPAYAQPEPAKATAATSLRPACTRLSTSLNAALAMGMGMLAALGGNPRNLENIPLVHVKAEKLPSVRARLQNPGTIIRVCAYTPGLLRRTAVGFIAPEAKPLSDTLCAFAAQTPKAHIKELTRAGDNAIADGNISWKDMEDLRAIAERHDMKADCTALQPEMDNIPSKTGAGEVGKAIALNVAGCIDKNETAARVVGSLFKRNTSPTR